MHDILFYDIKLIKLLKKLLSKNRLEALEFIEIALNEIDLSLNELVAGNDNKIILLDLIRRKDKAEVLTAMIGLKTLSQEIINDDEDPAEEMWPEERLQENISPPKALSALIQQAFQPIHDEIDRLKALLNERSNSFWYLDSANEASSITKEKIEQLKVFHEDLIDSLLYNFETDWEPIKQHEFKRPETWNNMCQRKISIIQSTISEKYQEYIQKPSIKKYATNYIADFLRVSLKAVITASIVGNLAFANKNFRTWFFNNKTTAHLEEAREELSKPIVGLTN
ncbi:MAG: hypothetical protein ACE365_02090 [Gammaproteobacteria bacterium]